MSSNKVTAFEVQSHPLIMPPSMSKHSNHHTVDLPPCYIWKQLSYETKVWIIFFPLDVTRQGLRICYHWELLWGTKPLMLHSQCLQNSLIFLAEFPGQAFGQSFISEWYIWTFVFLGFAHLLPLFPLVHSPSHHRVLHVFARTMTACLPNPCCYHGLH